MKLSALTALIGVSSAQTWCSSTDDCLALVKEGEDFFNDKTCCIRKTVTSIPDDPNWGRFATEWGCDDDGCGKEMSVGNSWTECETEAYIDNLVTYTQDYELEFGSGFWTPSSTEITSYMELDNNWVTYMSVYPDEKELYNLEYSIGSTDSWITTWESDVETHKASIMEVQCMDANATGLAAGIATVAAVLFAAI